MNNLFTADHCWYLACVVSAVRISLRRHYAGATHASRLLVSCLIDRRTRAVWLPGGLPPWGVRISLRRPYSVLLELTGHGARHMKKSRGSLSRSECWPGQCPRRWGRSARHPRLRSLKSAAA